MSVGFQNRFQPRLLMVLFFLACLALPATLAWSAPAQKSTEPDPQATTPTEGQIQSLIKLLEDEKKRQDLVTLLKMLAVMENNQPAPTDEAPAQDDQGLPIKSYLQDITTTAWRDLTSSGANLDQSWRSISETFKALTSSLAVSFWQPYLLETSIWGLICLVGTWVLGKRYGRKFSARQSPTKLERFKIVGKYILAVATPNLILIFGLLAYPSLSTTAPGVTADMAQGFIFIEHLVQNFFITLSILYIALQVATALFTPGIDGHRLIDIHPVLARHFLHSWRVFATYIAVFAFLNETILSNFTNGIFYSLMLTLLTLPSPIYLTMRLLKLKKLVHLIGEIESTSSLTHEAAEPGATWADEDESQLAAKTLDYQVDLFFRKHWTFITIILIWILSLLSLINPAATSQFAASRLVASLVVLVSAMLIIKSTRYIMRRLTDITTDTGRRLSLNADNFINALTWGVATLFMMTIWGLPLEKILANQLAQDVLGRALAIFITIVALLTFIRFSRLVTEWLLSVPNLGQNRNWRTMAPLALTAIRALAIFIGLVVIFERLGVNVGPILAGAGILGLGVGMGAQSLVKDLINGISILLMDTLAVGDFVTIGGKSGTVEEVGLRTIRLRDSAGNLTVVPNSSVDTIVNMTKDYSQDLVEFTVPYDANPDDMLQLATEEAQELSQDIKWKFHMTAPVTVMGVTAFDANGTTIRLKVNTVAGSQWSVGRELRLRLKRRMLQDGLKSYWFGQNVFVYPGDLGTSQAQPQSQPPYADETEPGLTPDEETESEKK